MTWSTTAIIVTAILAAILAACSGNEPESASTPTPLPADEVSVVATEAPTQAAPAAAATAAATRPDTACIGVEGVMESTFQVQNEDDTGTAFYIGNGEWVTNHHVVDAVTETLLVHADAWIPAVVVGSLPEFDLALLRADPLSDVRALSFAASPAPVASPVSVVGFPVYVQGTPSVTRGVVSKYAPLAQFGLGAGGEALQTDAAINPGNSGGPIVDDCGDVIAVAAFGYDTTPSGRPVVGTNFGIAAETVVAQLASLRSTAHVLGASGALAEDVDALTISAFCTSPVEPMIDDCLDRAANVDPANPYWIWATGVVNWDDVLYSFNAADPVFEDGVADELLALSVGCHSLEIAEDEVSTHWSDPYEFCIAALGETQPVPKAPIGLRLTATADGELVLGWDAAPGATYYEVYRHAAGDSFEYMASVTTTAYVDQAPDAEYYNSYVVLACNDAGCSPDSAVVTEE